MPNINPNYVPPRSTPNQIKKLSPSAVQSERDVDSIGISGVGFGFPVISFSPQAKAIQDKLHKTYEYALGKDTEVRYYPQTPWVTPPDKRTLKEIIPNYNNNFKAVVLVSNQKANKGALEEFRIEGSNIEVLDSDLKGITPQTKRLIRAFMKGTPTKRITNPNRPEGRVLNVAITAERETAIAEKELGVNLFGGTKSKLPIYIEDASFPHYDPQTKDIFFDQKSVLNTDVPAHEIGHAIVDAIRPEWNRSVHPETSALHEAMADIQGTLVNADNPEVIKKTIDNFGDIRKDNPVMKIAEGYLDGKEIRKIDDDRFPLVKLFTGDKYKYKRYSQLKAHPLADVDYKALIEKHLGDKASKYLKGKDKLSYKEFKNILSELPPEEAQKLGNEAYDKALENDEKKVYGEEHSFSRVFSSSVYDALKEEYKARREREKEKEPEQVFASTVKDIRSAVYKGLKISPAADLTFKDMAISMVAGDKLFNGGKVADSLEKSFKEKGIISDEDIKHLNEVMDKTKKMNITLPSDFQNTLDSGDFNKVEKAANPVGKKFIQEATKQGLFKVDKGLADKFTMEGVQRDNEGRTIITYTAPIKDVKDFFGNNRKLRANMVLVFDKNGKLIYGNLFGVEDSKERIEDTVKFQKDRADYL